MMKRFKTKETSSYKWMSWILAYVLLIISVSAQTPTPDDKRISVNTEIVNLAISVTDREGRAVTGLRKDNLLVIDDGKLQELTFFSNDDVPVSVGIAFDTSESMKGKKIELARSALEKFVQTSHPEDEYFLIAFNDRSQLLLDHSLHGEDIIKQLERAEPSGNTSLYDAVYLGIDRVQNGKYERKVLLIITDGQDNKSRYDAKEVLRLERESGVMVYAVGLLNGMFIKERRNSVYRLDDLTKSTGGQACYPSDLGELENVFEKIALEIRHVYSMGYAPSNLKNDGSWHKLKIRLQKVPAGPGFRIRGRSGYFETPAIRLGLKNSR